MLSTAASARTTVHFVLLTSRQERKQIDKWARGHATQVPSLGALGCVEASVARAARFWRRGVNSFLITRYTHSSVCSMSQINTLRVNIRWQKHTYFYSSRGYAITTTGYAIVETVQQSLAVPQITQRVVDMAPPHTTTCGCFAYVFHHELQGSRF